MTEQMSNKNSLSEAIDNIQGEQLAESQIVSLNGSVSMIIHAPTQLKLDELQDDNNDLKD